MPGKKRNGPVSWKERERRPARRFLLGAQRGVYLLLARVWRVFLFRTTFIGITGSVGKTTCKELLAAILASQHPTAKTVNNQNDLNGVPKTVLRVRPWHRYAVVEIGSGRKGLVKRSVELVRPTIGVFLNVAQPHVDDLGSLEAIAGEKSELIRRLSGNGLAVLNGDDPLVARCKNQSSAPVVTFGAGPGNQAKAGDGGSQWPDRLAFEAEINGSRALVATRLVGTHWMPSVMAALLAGVSCGISLEDALEAIESVPPFPARLQPVRHPSSAVLLRDEYNGSIDTLLPALELLREARVQRRVLVFNGLSWMPISSSQRFKKVGTLAASCADLVVFISKSSAGAGIKAARAAGLPHDNVLKFKDIWQASRFLKKELRPGDLVLIRGKGAGLARLVHEQFGRVGCQREKCHKTMLCDTCTELKAENPLQLI